MIEKNRDFYFNFESVQFDDVLRKVGTLCCCPLSSQLIEQIEPNVDLVTCQYNLDLTAEAFKMIEYARNPMTNFFDISTTLEKCRVGMVCNPSELFGVLTMLNVCHKIESNVSNSEFVYLLQNKCSDIVWLHSLRQQLADSVDGDIVKDNASDKLRHLRRQKASANARLQSRLQGYARGGKYSQYLQDDIVTMREGRYVLPVKAEHKGSVDGLVHDQSASGSTIFVEPYEIVVANNELKALIAQEKIEVERVLQSLTKLVAEHVQSLSTNFEICVEFDIVFAKASYSIATKSTMPVINKDGIIDLKNARHPLLHNNVVPISVQVGGDNAILLISGPNTGGKTVTLKMIGLCSLMASCGIFVPCDEYSQVGVFSHVFCLIGDGQSIEQSLSTFSAHISRLVNIVDNVTQNSLVLIDELGAGTDPQEGAAIALATIKYLASVKCTTVVTSHYNALKEYATVTDGICNASIKFDIDTLMPTYKLTMNIPGASYALKIAKKFGLKQSILDNAYSSLSDDAIAFDKMSTKMQEQADQLDRQLAEVLQKKSEIQTELDRAKRKEQEWHDKNQKINENAKKITEQLVWQAKQKAENLVEQIKEQVEKGNENALFSARAFKNQIDDIKLKEQKQVFKPLVGTPKKGDKVLVKSLGSVGTIHQVKSEKSFLVTVGALSVTCDISNLAQPNFEQPKQKNNGNTNSNNNTPRKGSKSNNNTNSNSSTLDDVIVMAELMLIGNTVSDAEILLQNFVESCVLNNQKHLRIVHGKGSGILGKAMQNYLRRLRGTVKSVRYGGYGEGDNGVTIVELC